jgi:hypothetical protein
LIGRLKAAAATLLSRPELYWALAAVFALRIAVLTVLAAKRPDTEGMWEGARAYLTNPSHMYDAAAAYLAASATIAPPGTLSAFVSPPPVALLAIPVALLPKGVAVQLWTGIDAAALIGALALLYRVLATRNRLAGAVFWFVAAYFPPVYADIGAGQRGGILLLGAMASIWLEGNRPALAGIAGGLAASLKYYPAAMVIGPRPAHRIRYAAALAFTALLVTAISFAPLGLDGARFYFEHVLIPSLASHNADCAYDSVRTLFMRTIGGEPYLLPAGNGLASVASPLHLPGLALFLSYASALLFAGGAVWAAWRSGWNPPYGMALGFALGALIPNEVWPYQWLPLLPLVLLVAVKAIEQRRRLTLVLLGAALLGFVRQPCDLIFPNLWTLAAIAVFVVGVWENRLFRAASTSEKSGGSANVAQR